MLKFHTTSFYKKILLKTFAAFRTESTFQIDSSSILRSFVRQNHSDLQQRNREVFVVQKSRLKCYYWCQGQHHLILLLWIGAILIYILQSCIFSLFSKAEHLWWWIAIDCIQIFMQNTQAQNIISHTCIYANIYTSVIFIPNHGIFELLHNTHAEWDGQWMAQPCKICQNVAFPFNQLRKREICSKKSSLQHDANTVI